MGHTAKANQPTGRLNEVTVRAFNMNDWQDVADKWPNLIRLDLEVYVDNAAAIHLYEKYGFEIEDTLRRYAFRDGEYVDSYVMARVRE